jgi:hypothetical protein
MGVGDSHLTIAFLSDLAEVLLCLDPLWHRLCLPMVVSGQVRRLCRPAIRFEREPVSERRHSSFHSASAAILERRVQQVKKGEWDAYENGIAMGWL